MNVKRLSPNVEKPFRNALGHAARAETEKLEDLLAQLTQEQVVEAIGLCAFAAGYTAIDVVGREWPNEENLRVMAKGAVKSTNARKLGLLEQDAYDFIARVALLFEPVDNVFPEPQRMLTLPFYITANLLAAFSPAGNEWWEFLDKIEAMLEVSENADINLTPAMMLRTRRLRTEAKCGEQQSSL
jgi:hypothetical protein